MSTFLGNGAGVFFGNTVRASVAVLTPCIGPIPPGTTVKIDGFPFGWLVFDLFELLEALAAGAPCILVGPGTYFITSTLVIPVTTKAIHGCGCASVIFRATGAFNMMSISNNDGFTIDGIRFDKNGFGSSVMTVLDSNDVSIDRCCFDNGIATYFFLVDTCIRISVTNCQFKENTSDALNLISVLSRDNIVSGNQFFNITGRPIYTNLLTNCVISKNLFQNCGEILLASEFTNFSNNVVENCDVITVIGDHANIESNIIHNGTAIGLNLTAGADNSVICSNVIEGCASTGLFINANAAVTGNLCLNNGGVGIAVSGAVALSGNRSVGNTDVAIEIQDSTGNASIQGNIARSGAAAPPQPAITIGAAGNVDVQIGENDAIATYDASGAISPADNVAQVIAAGALLSMTLADLPKPCQGHHICIENDGGPANVEVTYNAADKIILNPLQNKVLEWNGNAWCVINKDCLEADLTGPPVSTVMSTFTTLPYTVTSASDNYILVPHVPSGTDIFVNTTGKYQVNAYVTWDSVFALGAPAARLAQIRYGPGIGGIQNHNNNPYENISIGPLPAGFTSLPLCAIVNVTDLTMPISIEVLQDLLGSVDIIASRISICRL